MQHALKPGDKAYHIGDAGRHKTLLHIVGTSTDKMGCRVYTVRYFYITPKDVEFAGCPRYIEFPVEELRPA